MADYTTTAQVKSLLKQTDTDTVRDAVIAQFVSAASAYIENETHKVFVAGAASARYLDVPSDGGRRIKTDTWFTSITSIVNGDGTTIPPTEYYAWPRNTAQHNTIVLKGTSGYHWTGDSSGNTEGTIIATCVWAWSASAPSDIRTACETIVVSMWHNRYGESAEGAATITGAGVVITPKDIPASAQMIIDNYKGVI